MSENKLSDVKALKPEEEWAQSLLLGDEWANWLTHGSALLLSVIGLYFLIDAASAENSVSKWFSYGMYGLSLVTLYAASTCYHALRQPKLKKLFRTIDHCAIYFLIAGSYTPITLLVLDDLWGWTLFGVVWACALVGIFLKITSPHKHKGISTALYLLMGWMVVIAADPLMARFHSSGLSWLFWGGGFYTAGVLFFILDQKRFFHAVWHLFVMGGSFCHYTAFLLYT